MRFVPPLATSVLLIATAATQNLLYDNGPIVTHPGAGFNGVDASVLDNLPPMSLNLYGSSGLQTSWSLADNFTVCGTWNVSELEFFAYQTGATGPTFTGVFARIWDGDPRAGGNIIWGDLTTNLLPSAPGGQLYCYRVLISSMTDTQRPVMQLRVPVPSATPLVLQRGVYWIEFQFTGTVASGPWVPPVTVLGDRDTGDAIQRQVSTNTWQQIDNALSGTPFAGVALPFRFYGTSSGQTGAMAVTYGAGKAGTNGVGAWDPGSPVRLPILGRDFHLRLTNGFAGSTPILALGTPFGTGLPLPPVGTAYVLPVFTTLPMAPFDPSNVSALEIPIPHGPNLCGLDLGLQAFWADPGAVGSIAHSDGLQIILGN